MDESILNSYTTCSEAPQTIIETKDFHDLTEGDLARLSYMYDLWHGLSLQLEPLFGRNRIDLARFNQELFFKPYVFDDDQRHQNPVYQFGHSAFSDDLAPPFFAKVKTDQASLELFHGQNRDGIQLRKFGYTVATHANEYYQFYLDAHGCVRHHGSFVHVLPSFIEALRRLQNR